MQPKNASPSSLPCCIKLLSYVTSSISLFPRFLLNIKSSAEYQCFKRYTKIITFSKLWPPLYNTSKSLCISLSWMMFLIPASKHIYEPYKSFPLFHIFKGKIFNEKAASTKPRGNCYICLPASKIHFSLPFIYSLSASFKNYWMTVLTFKPIWTNVTARPWGFVSNVLLKPNHKTSASFSSVIFFNSIKKLSNLSGKICSS